MSEDGKKELCARMAAQLPILRKMVGATQQQLAETAGLTRNTIIRIERSRTMSWNTYLSLLMLFSWHEDARKLIRTFGLYPSELEKVFAKDSRAL